MLLSPGSASDLSALPIHDPSVNLVWLKLSRRFSYGANRVQVDADVKVCAEFLNYLHNDSLRGGPLLSSLPPVQLADRGTCEPLHLPFKNDSLNISAQITQIIFATSTCL